MIDQAHLTNDILGVGMYTSTMGNFNLPSIVNYIESTSPRNTYGDFYSILDKNDPCILPMQFELKVPSPATKVAY